MSIDELTQQGWEATRYKVMGMTIYIKGDDRAYYKEGMKEPIYKYNLRFK